MKKIISILLSICLLVTLIPAFSFAETETDTVKATSWDEVTKAISDAQKDTVIDLQNDIEVSLTANYDITPTHDITITSSSGKIITFKGTGSFRTKGQNGSLTFKDINFDVESVNSSFGAIGTVGGRLNLDGVVINDKFPKRNIL